MASVNVLGVRLHPLDVDGLHAAIGAAVDGAGKALVLNANAYGLNLARRRPWLRDILNRADIVFTDGAGVVLAARLLGHRGLVRITYADWTWQLAEFAERRAYSLYFLGGQPGVAQEAAANLVARHPGLRIAGTAHGYFDQTPGSADSRRVIDEVNASGADILLVGFGMPLQEAWLAAHWADLRVHVGLTGGAVFDYISGRLRRGPRWMTDNGLEWLARLVIEPGRLWRRYVLGNPAFLASVLLQLATSRPQPVTLREAA